MKLTVKTIKGEVFKIDVESFTTVLLLLSSIILLFFFILKQKDLLNKRKDFSNKIILNRMLKIDLKRKRNLR